MEGIPGDIAVNRYQTFHEQLIPLLVEGMKARTYLEFGTHENQTISKVKCERRFGVDIKPTALEGVHMFSMTTEEFIRAHVHIHAPYDLVFIDADHNAAMVEDDFKGVYPHVAENGLVCLHDTQPESVADTDPTKCGTAWIFAKNLKERGFESVTLPYCPGLTIVRKRIGWGPQ